MKLQEIDIMHLEKYIQVKVAGDGNTATWKRQRET